MPYSEAYFVNSAVPRIPNLRITFALWNGARGAWRPSMPGPWSLFGGRLGASSLQ